MSKKLEQKQARREAEERRKKEAQAAARKRNLITLGLALVVTAAVVALVVADRQAADAPTGVSASAADCSEVQDFEATSRDHIDQGAAHEPYNSTPPTNGPHFGTPADTGFYSSALPVEQPIHNLEHGQIVIWYSPDAPQEVIDDIEAIVEKEPAATLATPFEGLEEGNFALTAWTAGDPEDEEDFGDGHLQTCEQVSQEVIDDFRTEFQGKSPEPITPRFNG